MTEAAERALRGRVKQALRERMSSVRRVLPTEACAARSARLCERVGALPELASARLIVGYHPLRKEASALPFLLAAEQAGKCIGLPRVQDDGSLTLHAHHAGAVLEEGAFGIEEPLASAELLDLALVDVILVPALAVDARGHRIGHGHGYYDRLLPRMPRAFKVAIAYDFQLLAELPDTEGDVTVDCVVTDERTLRTLHSPRPGS